MPGFMKNLRLVRRRREKNDVSDYGTPSLFHMRFEHRELPDAGAQQYANESLALPPYMPWQGISNTRSFQSQQAPIVTRQGVVLSGVIPAGQMSGQIVTQPLLDPSLSQNLGITPLALANNQMPTFGAY